MGCRAVVSEQPGLQAGVDEQRMADPALDRGPPFHELHHGGVVADAGVEAEVPAVHLAEPDRAGVVGVVEGDGEHLDRADRVVREPDRSGEDVRRAAREHTECGVRSGDAGGDFVQCAVAAEPDDDIDAASRGVLREPGRMAPPVRLDERHFVPSGQLLMDHDGVPRGDRRRERVDDEQQSQGMRR